MAKIFLQIEIPSLPGCSEVGTKLLKANNKSSTYLRLLVSFRCFLFMWSFSTVSIFEIQERLGDATVQDRMLKYLI